MRELPIFRHFTDTVDYQPLLEINKKNEKTYGEIQTLKCRKVKQTKILSLEMNEKKVSDWVYYLDIEIGTYDLLDGQQPIQIDNITSLLPGFATLYRVFV